MLLKDTFYTLLRSEQVSGTQSVHHAALRPDSPIYNGHFPGKPVTPGVCEIELTKELAILQTGRKLLLSTINLCRFKAVASPAVCPEVTVTMELTPSDTGYKMVANVVAGETIYMEIKAELTAEA
jgi:3-hydroxyacyl-[acyl-carrier-protein] dehydratase